MSVSSNAFYLNSKLDQIIEIFLDFRIMFAISKTNKLGITIIVILITYHAELLKISSVQTQVNIVALENINGRKLFQVAIKSAL